MCKHFEIIYCIVFLSQDVSGLVFKECSDRFYPRDLSLDISACVFFYSKTKDSFKFYN